MGPSTTLLVREVENGWVIDVEMLGAPQPMGVVQTTPDVKTVPMVEGPTVRFCKFVARSGVEMLNTLAHLLSEFESREPFASSRIIGNLDNSNKRLAVVSRLKGGYMIDATQRVKAKLSLAPRFQSLAPRFQQLALLAQAQGMGTPPAQEIEIDESVQEVIVDLKDVLSRLGEFFGVKGE